MDPNGMKVGCAAVFQKQELLKRLPNESSIYIAEAIATDKTMNIIRKHKSSKCIIYSDSKSVLQALQSKDSSTPLITRLLDKMNILSKNNGMIKCRVWKSDLTDKMKRSFFQAAVVSILLYGCTTWTLTKRL